MGYEIVTFLFSLMSLFHAGFHVARGGPSQRSGSDAARAHVRSRLCLLIYVVLCWQLWHIYIIHVHVFLRVYFKIDWGIGDRVLLSTWTKSKYMRSRLSDNRSASPVSRHWPNNNHLLAQERRKRRSAGVVGKSRWANEHITIELISVQGVRSWKRYQFDRDDSLSHIPVSIGFVGLSPLIRTLNFKP